MHISSNFDSGNIAVLEATDPQNIRLDIKKDNQSDFYQWFHFRVSNVRDTALHMRIENAAGAAYAGGWNGYQACFSYDRENWMRTETDYKDGVLHIHHTPEADTVYFAYFAPYSMEYHHDLIAQVATSPLAQVHVLGHTLDGQDMDLVEISDGGDARLNLWLTARQHPGETMAEWWMEGFLERLLDENDPVSRSLLSKARFFAIPNMNPDGSRRGHLRTNAAGANLNREWDKASMAHSPEVKLVLNEMDKRGVDFHFDIHGDEDLPYNFIAGFEGIPNITDHQLNLLERFKATYATISPDFQVEEGYPPSKPGEADLSMCTNQVANRFGCLAMTLEMPFKDNANLPDETAGWSPERSHNLGRAALDVIHALIDDLRP